MENKPIKIDETDLIILRVLQEDSKKTAKEIAARLELTVSPVYERIKRLEKYGYIKKYVVILDKKLFDLPVTAICHISMRYHSKSFIENFEQEIMKLDEVQECYHMAGKVDFILKINTKSLEDYHSFMKYKLSNIENIAELNTSFVLKDVKETSAINI